MGAQAPYREYRAPGRRRASIDIQGVNLIELKIMVSALEKTRKKIDAVDSRLAPLLAARFGLVRPLAGLKKSVRDPAREAAVLKHAGALVKTGELRTAVAAVYKEIFRQGRRIQNAHKA